MNAYELADKLQELDSKLHLIDLFKSADMLRQQADRIAELEKQQSIRLTLDRKTRGLVAIQTPQTKPLSDVDLGDYEYQLDRAKLFNQMNNKQTKPLSDEEITKLHLECWDEIEFARAIEERHGIK